jgi:hypothetical protein
MSNKNRDENFCKAGTTRVAFPYHEGIKDKNNNNPRSITRTLPKSFFNLKFWHIFSDFAIKLR